MKAVASGQGPVAKWFRSSTVRTSLPRSGWLRAASISRHAVSKIGSMMLVQSGRYQNRCGAGVKNDAAAKVVAAIQGQITQAAAIPSRTRTGKLTGGDQLRASRSAPGKSKSWL